MAEHLTREELLTSLKYCKGHIGGRSCKGCPNAVPGTEDSGGFCRCRVDTYEEMIYFLEKLIKNQ